MTTAAQPVTTAATKGRIIDLDVTRAGALIGVCVMNYHGYLILDGGSIGEGFWAHTFNPWEGPMATRYAATFVVVAGMGVTLLTRGANGPAARAQLRLVLVRRGLTLFAGGYVLNWIWPGTILFYYGAMFVIAALIFHLRTEWIAAIGFAAAFAGAYIAWWGRDRAAAGHNPTWLYQPGPRSVRGLIFDTFVNGTHPLLPWLAFFCIGIVAARHMPWPSSTRVMLAFVGVLAVVATYAIHLAAPDDRNLSVSPWSRSLVYTICAAGSAVVVVCVIGAIALATSESRITRAFAAAGRCTLTMYVGHALVYNLVVHWLGWVRPTGLDTALAFAAIYWVVGITAAAWWTRHMGLGPLERLYRALGGPHR